jgi:acyl-CoA hydrolase
LNLKEMYKSKLMSAEDAVKLVRNHTEVWIGIAVPVPLALGQRLDRSGT